MSGNSLLEQAAQWFSAEDRTLMDEFDNWDHSYRLLNAAAVGGPVEPVPADRARTFESVVRLENGPIADSWARLV